ncbi:BA14K family protein [Caulobacter hibisci]|uniref:BA14K family protein n=1 Tax=Caulobacter hibisci TaxID=2035993 RepID=A0ABS0ST71_9CAUL|nr:BA14K family protein [Caulobacter hibisci]MBI1682411.1 BA14K family protein [Caulobacter hibisci]
MKAVLAALALSVAAVSSPVLAQPQGGHDQHGAQPAPATQQRHDAKPGKESKQDRHVRACKAKYRSYDAKRDAFRGPNGKWIKCRL